MREELVTEGIRPKIDDAITNRKPLFCLGYYFRVNLAVKGDFAKPLYFSEAKFQGIELSRAKFSEGEYFFSAEFSGEAKLPEG